jgi:phage tail sheath protein FI
MPANLTYPGVYIEEIPSGVRTITGVATSITAFIGRARRGPVNEPKLISNFGEFERLFGALSTDHTMAYAVNDFFGNGGSQAIIVRLYKPLFATDADWANALLTATTEADAAAHAISDAATAAIVAGATADDVADAADAEVLALVTPSPPAFAAAQQVAAAARTEATRAPYMIDRQRLDITGGVSGGATPSTGTFKLKFTAADGTESTGPTIAFEDLMDTTAIAETALTNGLLMPPAIVATDIVSVTRTGVDPDFSFSIEFGGNLAAPQKLLEVVDDAFAGDGHPTVTVVFPLPDADTVAQATAAEIASAVASAAGNAAPRNRASLTVPNGLELEAATPGTWANALTVEVDHNTKPKDDGSADATLYNLTITDGLTGRRENIRNVTNTANAVRFVGNALANESSLVRVAGVPTGIRPNATAAPMKISDPGKFAADSQPLVAADFEGSLNAKTGIYALENADLFNILCIPPDTRDGDLPSTVYQKAMKYCFDKRAMLIVDPPAAWGAKPNDAVGPAIAGLSTLGLNGLSARNAALFFPRIQQSDPMRDGQLDIFVACGAIAGIFSRTDSTRGVWKAPAGLDASISGITGLQVNLSDLENGQHNPLAINDLRSFPNAGPVVWGARTLRGANSIGDEYKYIPIRRLALFIEETLYRNTKWVVFEPNDEPLWAQIRLNFGAFMHNLFRQGAFQGMTPKDAYFVKCDKETTTQADINLGIVNIIVGFAPLKPAEFVVIKIQQMAGQIET